MNKKITTSLFFFYIFFTVYNTLIPFSFDHNWHELPELISHVNLLPDIGGVGRFSLTDFVGNILLFIPFGFLAYLFFSQRKSAHPILYSIFGGAFLSFSIEFVQLFIDKRNTAVHDWINNIIGTGGGAAVAAIYSVKFSITTRKIFYELLDKKPFILIPLTIGVLQIFAAAMPLTVSITISDLVKSIKSTNIIPFTYQSIGALFLNSPNKHDIETIQVGFDFTPMIEDIIFWAVVGYMLMLCYRLYWRKKRYGKRLLIFLPLFYFPMLEAMQVIIVHRITDINDILSGYGGIALGYGIYFLLRPLRRKQYHELIDLLKIPLVMYGVFILFSGLRPFDWSLSYDVIKIDLRAESLVPFYTYFRHTSLNDIYDLVDSLTFFLPISLYWTYRMKTNGKSYPVIYIFTTLTALAIGAFIEVTQLFSVERVAEITDILAYAGGGALGTFLIYYHERQVVPTINLFRRGLLKFGGKQHVL